MKNPNEVLRAAKTRCEDIGAQHALLSAAGWTPDGGWIQGTGVLTYVFSTKIERTRFFGIKASGIQQIKIETLDATPDYIDVRARIFADYPNNVQVVEPEIYNRLFKSIGDSIFIEAVKIDPAVQE